MLLPKLSPTGRNLDFVDLNKVQIMWLSQDVERIIMNGYADGRARFGEIGIDLATYVDRIRFIVHKNLGMSPPDNEAAIFIKKLHLNDLYLATACAKESLGFTEALDGNVLRNYSSLAWKTLEREYKSFVRDLARFFSRLHFLAWDLEDNILADLFMPDRFGHSRIMSYDGRSSLCTWLRVILSNRAINIRRGKAYTQTEEMETSIPDQPVLANLDRMICAKRYGDRLTDSMRWAFSQLAERERLLLLWRYEDGLQLAQIAKFLDIHPSNVSRRLKRLHRKLRNRIVASLTIKHGLSQSAIDECLQDIVDKPYHDISLLDALQAEAGQSGHDGFAQGPEHLYFKMRTLNS